MGSGKEQRSHPRLEEQSTIFIETRSSSDGNATKESILICNSVEISAGGLRVCVDEELPPGTILQLGVELPDFEQPLYLVGEVRWSKPAEAPNTGYHAGFQLLESAGTDYEIWKELLTELA